MKNIACLSLVIAFTFYPLHGFNERADALFKESYALAQQHKKEGIQKLHEVLAIDPTHLQANFLLGLMAQTAGQYHEAEGYYHRAAASGDDRYNHSSIYNNLGNCSLMLGDLATAKKQFEESIRLEPSNNCAHKSLGEIYLTESDFTRGWQELALSWGADWNNRKAIVHNDDLTGVTVLLHDGDGFGDTFNWLRYAKVLKQRNATVIIKTRPALIPLLQQCDYIDQIIPSGKPLPSCTVEFGFLQLTPALCKTINDIPTEVPYMSADPERVAFWEQELNNDRNFKIGICWECKTYVENITQQILEKKRAIPLMHFYQLSTMKNVSLYSLQRVDGLDQLKGIPSDFTIHRFNADFDAQYGKFMDTAAVMKNLDLVITVDTSIAHLAGALGVPVWVVLPSLADWRWFQDRDDSPWYPTMRLFRQPKPGDWDSVMKEVQQELVKLITTN